VAPGTFGVLLSNIDLRESDAISVAARNEREAGWVVGICKSRDTGQGSRA
jgi:hypothetical protein